MVVTSRTGAVTSSNGATLSFTAENKPVGAQGFESFNRGGPRETLMRPFVDSDSLQKYDTQFARHNM